MYLLLTEILRNWHLKIQFVLCSNVHETNFVLCFEVHSTALVALVLNLASTRIPQMD